MHEPVFNLLAVWHAALIAVLVLWAARANQVFHAAVALDTMAPLFVGLLALVAIHTSEASYLDIAIVVALLSFAQAVGVARLVARRREQRGPAREGDGDG